jgi:uncharacterized protein
MKVAAQQSAFPDRLRVGDDGRPVLLGVQCDECGAAFFGDAEYCQRCTSDRLHPIELGDAGEVHSFTVVYRPSADWAGPTPYALVDVLLPAGVVVASRLADWEEGVELQVGSRLELATESIGEDEHGNDRVIYVWRRPA